MDHWCHTDQVDRMDRTNQMDRTDRTDRTDHVEVMLSTWNGSAWLQPQLDSLAAQTGVSRVTLSVRDDGSTDETWSILERFAKRVRTASPSAAPDDCAASPAASQGGTSHSGPACPDVGVRLDRGVNLGFIASFFTLLLRADPHADWYAFSDQDDVWQPDKLARAVGMLRQEAARRPRQVGTNPQCPAACVFPDGPPPLLYASRLTLVDEALRPIGQSSVPGRGPAFENAVVENIVTGATLVMNRAARKLLGEGLARMTGIAPGPEAEVPRAAVEGVRLHDWWCYLVVSAFGRVVFDNESHVLYRQHGGNQVGWRPSFLARQMQRFTRLRRQGDVRAITRQAALFALVYGTALDPGKRLVLRRFLAKDERLSARIACAVHPGVWRQGRADGLLLRVLILSGRI